MHSGHQPWIHFITTRNKKNILFKVSYNGCGHWHFYTCPRKESPHLQLLVITFHHNHITLQRDEMSRNIIASCHDGTGVLTGGVSASDWRSCTGMEESGVHCTAVYLKQYSRCSVLGPGAPCPVSGWCVPGGNELLHLLCTRHAGGVWWCWGMLYNTGRWHMFAPYTFSSFLHNVWSLVILSEPLD